MAVIVIEVRELTKRYGAKTAVDSLTFTVKPGIVAGSWGRTAPGSPLQCATSEMALTAQHLIAIGRGKLIAELA
jgi:ABC-type Na+ transport system ATPase subunit NatA